MRNLLKNIIVLAALAAFALGAILGLLALMNLTNPTTYPAADKPIRSLIDLFDSNHWYVRLPIAAVFLGVGCMLTMVFKRLDSTIRVRRDGRMHP